MGAGLLLFQALCAAGNAVEDARDRFPPAGDAWTALTELLQSIDDLVDALVEGMLEWEE